MPTTRTRAPSLLSQLPPMTASQSAPPNALLAHDLGLRGALLGSGDFLGAGITTAFIVLGPSLTGSAEAGDSLAIRLLLIVSAVLYVVLAFGFLERLTRGKRRLAT